MNSLVELTLDDNIDESVAEFLITLSFIAIEVLGYMVLVKLTPVLPNLENHGHKH